MSTSQASKWGGLFAMLAGLLIIIWVIADATGLDLFVAFVPAAVLFLYLSFPAMHRSQGGQDGAGGKVGYWILMVAGGLFLVIFLIGVFLDLVLGKDPEEAVPALFGGPVFAVVFFGLLLGILIFGIASIVAGVMPRLAALFFLLGLPLGFFLDFVVFQVGEEESGPGFYIGIPLFGLGLLWIGWWIWSRGTAAMPSAPVNAE